MDADIKNSTEELEGRTQRPAIRTEIEKILEERHYNQVALYIVDNLAWHEILGGCRITKKPSENRKLVPTRSRNLDKPSWSCPV